MDPSPFNFPEEKSEQFPPNLQDRESSSKLQEKSTENPLLETNIDPSSSNDVIDHSTPNLLNDTSQSCLYQHSPPSIQGINPIL